MVVITIRIMVKENKITLTYGKTFYDFHAPTKIFSLNKWIPKLDVISHIIIDDIPTDRSWNSALLAFLII